MTASERKPISEQLREAIRNAEVTRYRIAKETGVTEAALSRFMNGLGSLSLDSVDKVGDYLGLDITTRKPSPRRRK